MLLRVKEVADLVGISVRTLHHYDDIGLLTPDRLTPSGYRLYSDKNLETLQQILFYKELGFSLQKIKQMILSPTFNREVALLEQRQMLVAKRKQLDQMIATIDKTIQHAKGVIQMSNKERFVGFDFSQNPYEKEARQRWGDEVVDKSNATLENMPKEEKKSMEEKMGSVYRELAALRHSSPASHEAQAAIKKWHDFLNQNFHHYSLEAFKQLGKMYVQDDRFTKNIDLFGDGLAQFMCDAMAIYSN